MATHFGLKLADTPEDFWASSFIKLKKNSEIHACFSKMWESKWEAMPNEGSVHDFPPDLVEKFVADWGAPKTKEMARFLSQDPLTTIRLHRRAFQDDGSLKPEVETWLKDETLPKSRVGNYAPRARIFRGFARVQRNDLFDQGFFEIQDEGSQVMSLYSLYPELMQTRLKPEPQTEKVLGPAAEFIDLGPITVVDACSGAGGKTLAIADAMRGKGRIFAYDIFERKVRSLKQRAERAGERNIQGVLIPKEDLSSLKKFEKSADVVLVDAPCSGYGVLRRNPDTKWNRKPAELERRESEIPLFELQMNVLSNYAPLVKKGGRLVYGVCTFLKAESLVPVHEFLNRNPEFELQSEGFIGPYDTDGFFMASLIRK